MDRVQQLVRDDIQRKHINYEINSDGVLIFHPSIDNINGYGTVHGGVLMTLADNSLIAASYLSHIVSPSTIFVTKQMEYKFLRNAILGDDIIFLSSVSNSVCTCYITQNNKLIGTATGIYYQVDNNRLSKL